MRVLLAAITVCLLAGIAVAAGGGMAAPNTLNPAKAAPATRAPDKPATATQAQAQVTLASLLATMDARLAQAGGGIVFSPSEMAEVDAGKAADLVRHCVVAARPGASAGQVAEQNLTSLCNALGLQRQRLGNLWLVTRQPTGLMQGAQALAPTVMTTPEFLANRFYLSMNANEPAVRAMMGLGPFYMQGTEGQAGYPLLFGAGTPGVSADALAQAALASIPKLSTLVSIQAKDEPLAEFMAKVAEQTGQRIEVHPAVPGEIKITATIAGLPAAEVIQSVAAQSGLLVRVDWRGLAGLARHLDDRGLESSSRSERTAADMEAPVVHIVPASEIKVTGVGGAPAPAAPRKPSR